LSNKNLNEFINNNKKDNLLLQRFGDNIKVIKKINFNLNDGEFFLVFDKSVDGKELFINYIDHIKKKTIADFFSGYRELILLNIQNRETFLKDSDERVKNIINNELFHNYYIQSQLYYEIMVVGKEIKELKMLYNDYDPRKFDYTIYENLPSDPSHLYYSNYSIIFFGLMFGSLLFLVIIFLNSSAVNKKKIFSLKNNL
jgi:energy-coupling factor transporter ATP-binding protein EcfA2